MKLWLAIEVLDHMPPVYANDSLYWNSIDPKYGDELVDFGYATRVKGAANGIDQYAYRRTEAGERLILNNKNGELKDKYDEDIVRVEKPKNDECSEKEQKQCCKSCNECNRCKQYKDMLHRNKEAESKSVKEDTERAYNALLVYALKPRIFWP